ncbi:MAG: sodium:solute symporter family protein, partial [Planctomycetes bacterium]|nr:sodium:solute symporter family protein [Planctomycetota bacterium]
MLGGYLLLLLVLGIFGWLKSTGGEEDYYLAGRGQGWVISSLTIMATFFSAFALLGAPGLVYKEGVVFALFSLNVPVAGLCVYLLGVRIWRLGRKYRFVTPGDMVSNYYGTKFSLRILVALAGFLYAIPYVVMQIKAGGLVSEELFRKEWGDDAFEKGAILLAAITMVYIMVGGMRSVAWTDAIQGLLLISGMLVAGFAMLLISGGVSEFSNQLNTELPEASLTAPGNTGAWQWTLLFTVCVLGSAGSMVQPAQWMRFYAARSAQTLRRGALIFGVVLTTCFILGVMLLGLAGQVHYPLKFRHSVDVAGGPAKLTNAIPQELQDSFSYAAPEKGKPGSVTWTW